ncbi:MAG: LytTR family DNA-binding domain-containing protein [Roseburia sp.]|nr:LytTR family DNA-binding domain-containing protein [Roseburia sp.]
MMSIAVCDDEIIECASIAEKIEKVLDHMRVPHVIRQFESGEKLLQAPESFDLVFLDILMPDLDGMKTAELFRKKSAHNLLIFLSTSRKYVYDAYEVEAFQYLLKPLNMGKLGQALAKAVEKTKETSKDFSGATKVTW